MTTPQPNSSSSKNSTPSSLHPSGSIQGDLKSAASSMGRSQGQQQQDAQKEGAHLDQFVSYVRENWKVILSELVSSGVTAYLTYSAKEKSARN